MIENKLFSQLWCDNKWSFQQDVNLAEKRNDFCKWKTVLLFYIKQIELDKRDNFNGGFFDGYLES